MIRGLVVALLLSMSMIPNKAAAVEVDGTSEDAIKLCVSKLIDVELNKYGFNGVKLAKIDIPRISEIYDFEGSKGKSKFSGSIVAVVESTATSTTCEIGSGLTFKGRLCSFGCRYDQFKVNAEFSH